MGEPELWVHETNPLRGLPVQGVWPDPLTLAPHPHRCLPLGTRHTSISTPWASTWTSGWNSSGPSESLIWGWATMTGSECPPPRTLPSTPTQAVKCQEPQIQAGRGPGGQGRALVSAHPCDLPHHGEGRPAPSTRPAFFACPHPPSSPSSDRAARGCYRTSGRFLLPWVTSLGGLV